jgi:hypothetical protein
MKPFFVSFVSFEIIVMSRRPCYEIASIWLCALGGLGGERLWTVVLTRNHPPNQLRSIIVSDR